VAFLDFRKAFDTVPHSAMLLKLSSAGVGGKLYSIIADLYANSSARVRVEPGQFTESFMIKRGVRQGCPLSPILFTIFINDIFSKINSGLSTEDGATAKESSKIPGLLFADDTVLVAETIRKMQAALRIVNKWSKLWGMSFNLKKCGAMVIPKETSLDTTVNNETERKRLEKKQLTLDDYPMPVVESYIYLGLKITMDLMLEKMALHRAVIGRAKLAKLSRFLGELRIPLKYRLDILKSVLLPTLQYGCELWGGSNARCQSPQNVLNSALAIVLLGSSYKTYGMVSVRAASRDLDIYPIYVFAESARIRLYWKFRFGPASMSWLQHYCNLPMARYGKRGPMVLTRMSLGGRYSSLRDWRENGVMEGMAKPFSENVALQKVRDIAWMYFFSFGGRSIGSPIRISISDRIYFGTRDGMGCFRWDDKSAIRGLINEIDPASSYQSALNTVIRLRVGAIWWSRKLALHRVIPSSYAKQCLCCQKTLKLGENWSHVSVYCTALNGIRKWGVSLLESFKDSSTYVLDKIKCKYIHRFMIEWNLLRSSLVHLHINGGMGIMRTLPFLGGSS
jgi:Reverse transcriptase (RNA-dependent DNA polymerase)